MPCGTNRISSQNHWRANNGHIYLENRWKRLHIFGKSSFLDLEPSTMTQTPCNFSPLLMFEFGRVRRCLAFPENPSVNSQWYIEPSTMIQTSRNFSPLLKILESIPRYLDKSIGEFSMVYIYI